MSVEGVVVCECIQSTSMVHVTFALFVSCSSQLQKGISVHFSFFLLFSSSNQRTSTWPLRVFTQKRTFLGEYLAMFVS